MKKLALIIAVAGIISLSSCTKETVCTHEVLGVKTTVTVGEKTVEVCEGSVCKTDDYTGSQADYVKSLEDLGFTCE